MTVRYPEVGQEVQAPTNALTNGVRYLSPQPGRTYIEVEPNYVTLHFALNTGSATSGTELLVGGWIEQDLLPAYHERDTARASAGPVGVVWRPDGVLALEGATANTIGSWVSGKVRAKRPGGAT